MKFTVKLQNELTENTLTLPVLNFLDQRIPPHFHCIRHHQKRFNLFLWNWCQPKQFGTFDVVLWFRCSGLHDSVTHWQQNVFYSQEVSRSVREDVDSECRCVNFRRVLDPRRAFLLASRVTGSAGDKPESADNKPGSTWECWRQTWECQQHDWEHLELQ
jgi:hypothetical protein